MDCTQDGRFHVKVVVPAGTRATVHLPGPRRLRGPWRTAHTRGPPTIPAPPRHRPRWSPCGT
ncbi:hypothetical protein OG889_40515 [Streptomyces sp. NBC_00481]|uniref:alpha-L-rhamnosidase C-terminal domain-containing protein n=1 Tax=unclassified Streptomyces TaxID=2593676 RepID=UPI002DDB30B6|nr:MULTISPECIES: alpha-L-rhamnosidase C-terminal domain-containing protein [unclassified Streptomyces]WRZ01758.1 hypothetical protein OG889_40515 [Streptomyces sp. NBC_00481]